MKNTTLVLVLIILSCASINAQKVHLLSSNDYVQEYQVSGTFHKDGLKAEDWTDLLEIEFMDKENSRTALPDSKVVKAENGRVNFNKIFSDSAVALVYAQFSVEAQSNTQAVFLISADDGAKVYVNGKNVHTYFGGGWGNIQTVSTSLGKGENNIVIKVPNYAWGWSLSVKVLEEDEGKKYAQQESAKTEHFTVLNSDLIPVPNNNFGYTFYPGSFPKLTFEHPGLAKEFFGGAYTMTTRWFDRELNEVSYPKKPGRYAYYTVITGKNGLVTKKSATLFCAHQDWMGWNERLSADLEYYPINGAPESIWEKHKDAIGQYAGFTVFTSIMTQKEGAVIQAFVDEMNRTGQEPGMMVTPQIIDGDYHARLKQKILGSENKYPKLRLPQPTGETRDLIKLSEKESRKYRKMSEELIEVGNDWMADKGSPFDMVVAREGKILFHDSWGEGQLGKFTAQTPTEIASITKLMTGMLFAQFVDQGIIGIDDPVGKYLPDVPLEGVNAITLRHCFTHTAGFDFFAHGVYGGVYNPWLESTLLLTIQDDTVATRLHYNGMGYDLAGKVMEVVSGKSIFRLFREYLYDPLKMNNTEHDWDLGYSVHSTAYDLAKVAQMILNKGTYGGQRFFSEETYEKLIPLDLNQFYPSVKQKWGIGMTVMDWHIDDEKTGKKRALVSDGIIGHGSATSSIFWVIPKMDMIITQSRKRGNQNFGPNYIRMMKVVEKYLVEK